MFDAFHGLDFNSYELPIAIRLYEQLEIDSPAIRFDEYDEFNDCWYIDFFFDNSMQLFLFGCNWIKEQGK